MKGKNTIFTIGHSTHPIEQFIEMLCAHKIERLIDIRTIPRSRTNPQFNQDALRKFLNNRQISYRHMKDLGGLRRTSEASINKGWRNASFRGYADYMQTDEFSGALERLIELANEKRSALMCAEAVPWRCHRSLVADALLVRGIDVLDIFDTSHAKPHHLSPMAQVEGTRITYPVEK
jgi:uncharacterized protein (DUF488 family)